MKKIFLIALACILVLFNPVATAGEKPAGGRVPPYLFCNVFLADGCFGIAEGDRLTMRVVTDFVQYDVLFSSGGYAHLYSGYNPNVSQEGKRFERCDWPNKFAECRMRSLSDGRAELIARRTEKSTAIHVLVDATVPHAIIGSFTRNIRSCKSNPKGIECDPD